jgi:hypothetical protein
VGDIRNIMVTETPVEFEIKFKKEVFKFKIKKLSWLRVTGILSKATSYSDKGTASVNMDMYYEEYLIAALVETPWSLDETRFVLRKLNPEFGDLLEDFVPKPGKTEGEQIGFFEKKSEGSSPVETKT